MIGLSMQKKNNNNAGTPVNSMYIRFPSLLLRPDPFKHSRRVLSLIMYNLHAKLNKLFDFR